MSRWTRYTGNNQPHTTDAPLNLPPAPPWREIGHNHRATSLIVDSKAVEMVNLALYLRRPLLITGNPGTGKSSLAYAVAQELGLGLVLHWPINTRSTINEGLYRYDALGRLNDSQATKAEDRHTPQAVAQQIADYIHLGPLGTAFLPQLKPRVVLIDELDKSDIDLPNDLLHIFEEGFFRIPELARRRLGVDSKSSQSDISVTVATDDGQEATITNGTVQRTEFPLVMMTSNGERDFPPAFLRRCIRLNLQPPSRDELDTIVRAHVGEELYEAFSAHIKKTVDRFIKQRDRHQKDLSTDQLLNVIYLLTQDVQLEEYHIDLLFQQINEGSV